MRRGGILLLLGMLTPGLLHAQGVLQFDRLTGFIGVRGRYSATPTGQIFSSQQWFRLNLRGAVVDPGLFNFEVGLWPTLTQSRLSTPLRSSGTNGRILGTRFQAHVLQARPLHGQVRYFRGSNKFWATNEEDPYENGGWRTNLDASVRWDTPLMILEGGYQRDAWLRLRFDGVQEIEIPDSYEAWRLTGFNRKTTFRLEERHNAQFPVATTLRTAYLENRQQWGKGSSFTTQLDGQLRSGTGLATTKSWGYALNLHLQHLRTLATDWLVNGFTGSANGSGFDTRGLAGGLNWNARAGTSLGLNGSWFVSHFGPARQRLWRLEPRAGVALGLPFGASLSLSGSVGYEDFTRSASGRAPIAVVREPHGVDQSGTFLLDNPDVDPQSVLLSGPNGEIYVLELDYLLTPIANLVQVVVLPGGRIVQGQTVYADYRFQPEGAADGSFLVASYAGDFGYRWLRLYHRRNLRDPGGVGGLSRADPLRYQSQSATGAQINLPLRVVTATLRAERLSRVDDGLTIHSNVVNANAAVRLLARLTGSVGASYQFSEQFGEGLSGRSKLYAGQATVGWVPRGNLQITGDLYAWRSTELLVTQRTQFGGALRIMFRPGLMEIDGFYRYRDWRTVQLTTDVRRGVPSHAFALQIGRKF